ncbi:MAG TPA: hypothetical protein VK886_15665 [Vicinamibacterales bacterium]|nr:hypothetical protein [Vicinamibacterales bacterium]
MILRPLQGTPLTALVIAAAGLLPATAHAQPVARSFEELRGRLLLGETVNVIDREGQTTRGRLVQLTARDLIVETDTGDQTMEAREVVQVRARRSDSLLNGALIGAAALVVPGAITVAVDESGCRRADSCAGAVAIWLAMGASIGVGIDALVKGDVTVMKVPSGGSRAIALAPVLGQRRRGVLCAIRF